MLYFLICYFPSKFLRHCTHQVLETKKSLLEGFDEGKAFFENKVKAGVAAEVFFPSSVVVTAAAVVDEGGVVVVVTTAGAGKGNSSKPTWIVTRGI